MRIEVRWLGRIPYREAWEHQHELVAQRIADAIPDRLLLLEHPPVFTLGRHADESYVHAPTELLVERGIEVIRVERGGEVTYHGPGQLVAYPIVRLADRGLLIQPFVRLLEQAMIETCATYGVVAGRREGLPGAWCDPLGPLPRKIGALGLRVEQGVSYHGIALNVTTDIADFGLIDPCGIPGAGIASIAREAGWPRAEQQPSTASVEAAGRRFAAIFERLIEEAPRLSASSAGAGGERETGESTRAADPARGVADPARSAADPSRTATGTAPPG